MPNASTATVGLTNTPTVGQPISVSRTVSYVPTDNTSYEDAQDITTSASTITTGSLTTTTAKYLRLEAASTNGGNIDISVYPASTDYVFATMLPGDMLLIPCKAGAIYRAVSTTGTCRLFKAAAPL